jgi:hypothetical protein
MSSSATGGSVLGGTIGTPRPMIEWGDSGFLYIGCGRYLHQYDGQATVNGTFTANKFTLPVGWTVTSLFDAGDYIGICAQYHSGTGWSNIQYKSRAAVFFWDGVSSTYNIRVYIDDPEIKNSLSTNGSYYLFCRDSLGEGNIRQWNGSSFEIIKNIKVNVPYGTSTYKYSRYVPRSYSAIDSCGDMILFGSSVGHGEMFMYGKPISGKAKGLFNFSNLNIATTESGNVETYGLCALKDKILISYYNPLTLTYPTAYLSLLDSNNPKFLAKTMFYEFPGRARIDHIRMYFKTLQAGQGDDILIETDYGKEIKQVGSIAYAIDGAIETKQLSAAGTICNNLRLIVDVDEGAGIKYGKIVIEYQLLEDDVE